MDIYALDKDFNLVTVGIPYVNLQWTRRYYEPGEFELQIQSRFYDTSWKYIAASDRTELGAIQSLEKRTEDGTVILAGFFYEQVLDEKVCYPRFRGSGSTESVCRDIFTRYKDDLPIELSVSRATLGDATTADFSDDPLGRKLYRILETREMSYSIIYDHVSNTRKFTIWKGLNRTQGNNDGVPFYTFSTEFGNISSAEIKHDESAYKNYCIIPANANGSGVEQTTVYVDKSNGESKRMITLDKRSSKPDTDQSLTDFKNALYQDGIEELNSHAIIESINVESFDAGAYMSEYDLGDKCDIIIRELGIELQLRIIEIREIFKHSGHSVLLEFGNNRKGGIN